MSKKWDGKNIYFKKRRATATRRHWTPLRTDHHKGANYMCNQIKEYFCILFPQKKTGFLSPVVTNVEVRRHEQDIHVKKTAYICIMNLNLITPKGYQMFIFIDSIKLPTFTMCELFWV